ncbi:MAG TPA: DUF6692 family protein [Longimicrobiales bacterium]|nr:DUF6692 family protein [Longimicrobiales bacterium]
MYAALVVALAIATAGCTENVAPGNDRESELDPPAAPAAHVSAEIALEGVDPSLLQPQILTYADLGNLPDIGGRCLFRFTEVGFPALAYGTSAVVKLNGRLISLLRAGEGRYEDGGIMVTIRSLDSDAAPAERTSSELVLRLPGQAHELGFHGVSTCEATVADG